MKRSQMLSAGALALSLLSLTASAATVPAKDTQPAPETLLVIADVDRGLAFVPEGSVIPSGVEITVRAGHGDESENRPLVFAYAEPSRFDKVHEAKAAAVAEAENEREQSPEIGSGSAVVSPNGWITLQEYNILLPDGSLFTVQKAVTHDLGFPIYASITRMRVAPGTHSRAFVERTTQVSSFYQSSVYNSFGSMGGSTALYGWSVSEAQLPATLTSRGSVDLSYRPANLEPFNIFYQCQVVVRFP